MVGPMAGENVAVTPKSANPVPRCEGGKSFNTRLNAVGINTAPVKPCKARNRIMLLRSQDQAHAIEKSRNKPALTSRYRLVENTPESQPVKGITMISATR